MELKPEFFSSVKVLIFCYFLLFFLINFITFVQTF